MSTKNVLGNLATTFGGDDLKIVIVFYLVKPVYRGLLSMLAEIVL